jgi:hypothetical protein
MFPRISSKRCPIRYSTARQSRVYLARCHLLCLRVNHLPLDTTARHTDIYSDRYKFATARFDVRSSNEELQQRYILTPDLVLPTSHTGGSRDR